MGNYSIQNMVLILALAMFATLSIGCGKMQSKGKAESDQGSAQSQSSTGAANQQTIEGCVVRQETAYYIQPAAGEKTKLATGDQDLSSHVGHNVRVSGTPADNSAQPSSSGSQTAAGTAGTSKAEPELMVTRVDVVAESCPAEIQKRIDQDKAKNNPK